MVSTRAGSKAVSPPPTSKESPETVSSSSSATRRTRAKPRPAPVFAHVPTPTTLLWLAVSVPLVVWDTVYTLGRPHTMEGGWLHAPLWVPYKLYGEVDHVYGWKAFNAGDGFTSAQGLLNAVECAMYLYYLAAWRSGRGRAQESAMSGRSGALALVVGFSAAVMTLSKTLLYWLNEYFSGFDNIGHNSARDLVLLWLIPNGLWLVFPTYMVISMAGALVDGLAGSA